MGSRDGFPDDKLSTSAVGDTADPPTSVQPPPPKSIRKQEQLSTRVGCGRVHRIIENDLDKCRVVAPNLPTKTDDLSHSTGHGWTTREKVVKG
uniref:Uncharacterized protein n=2 Tax=Oryza sativa subsp. japonica TaxID=39947 RepID=Q7G5R7_ORYSJ|nr:hypothetical protein Os03g44990 [Oryza sativa Japonica Group]AAP68400.1 hypothetical protein [Oryza sativa Japonica Group]ABF97940.1 hypothetical protein LOC_Os03g44990 [Oryza sativa Japonica Group]